MSRGTFSPGGRESVGGLSRYPTKTPGRALFPRGSGARGCFNLHFSLNPPPEPELSGPHSRKWESYLWKIPVLPLFTLLEEIPICYHSFCLFRRVCEFPETIWGAANPINLSSVFFSHRSSAFSLFGSSIQFHPLEQGSTNP